jgi:hypothetical protein
MENGRYEVLFVAGQKVGQFAVYDNEIIEITGDALKRILSIGKLSDNMNAYRIETTLHNGYYYIQKIV